MRILFILFSILLFLSTETAAQLGWTKSYENAVVVTADRYASEIGVDIIRQGGNAVDAAVAMQFALTVTYPQAGNIGGGGFMVIRMADGTLNALDFREVAPAKASKNMYLRNGEVVTELSRTGALAVGVPGTVDGMIKAHDRYGRLPLETVMMPSIRLARDGYALPYFKAMQLNRNRKQFMQFESTAAYFTKPDSTEYLEGDVFTQPDLAGTLERISRFGRSGFYNGVTAKLIVDEMKKNGGLITLQDLRNYESKWRDVHTAEYKGWELHMMPLPSSGSVAIHQMLEMISDYDLQELGHNSADYIHLLAEAMKRAFADRSYYLGDPDFIEVPVDKLTDAAYNRERMQNFSMEYITPAYDLSYGDVGELQESDQTTHFSIMDTEGNAVAVTTTLNGSFGSKLAVGGAGFLLNNEMDDFSAKPGEPNMFGLIGGEANAIQPGKRMLSSMTPTIVTRNGQLRMVLGAAGGSRIITTVLQTFLNMAEFEMSAVEAAGMPRFHHQWLPDLLRYEGFGLNPDSKLRLVEKGYDFIPLSIGRTHLIYVDEDGIMQGAPDPRGDGYSAGF
jgi:gamma-glutamyltranspeptidase/glutathione hydrolase